MSLIGEVISKYTYIGHCKFIVQYKYANISHINFKASA